MLEENFQARINIQIGLIWSKVTNIMGVSF